MTTHPLRSHSQHPIAHVTRTMVLILVTSLMLIACGDDDSEPAPTPTPTPTPGDIFAKMGEPVPFATDEQRATFDRGLALATRRFAPADGLGPHMTLTFCAGCHEKPVFGGGGPRYRNFMLVSRQLSDGSTIEVGTNGILSHYDLSGTEPSYAATDSRANHFATRNPIPFFGVGLLAEIPEEEILQYADPNDTDQDGISGRPNFDRGFVGRFGRKAQTVSIEGFIRGPLFNHQGLTTAPLSDELKAQLPVPSDGGGTLRSLRRQAAAPDAPNFDDDGVADPEVPQQDLFDLIAFAMLMAPPAPEPLNEQTTRGRQHFMDAGCASCHVPVLNGPRGAIPAYTDLLLHDMGPALADGVMMGNAEGSEFRTAPLWGIVAVAPYLHDGRADTLDDAIRWHGGEGQASRAAYEGMSDAERADLLAFLASLGGSDQLSEGLLAPESPMPNVGEYGGPTTTLTAEAQAQFLEGRAVFDRDMGANKGLGPVFNGDSCRACHFEPVIGGAGPIGVNVIRQGTFNGTTFEAPAAGTLLHRFHADNKQRPAQDERANVFELRQAPALFGLGLIEQIPEETILALADPEDTNMDGISGRAHILSTGRLGRFGWKADIPDVEEFLRDAMTAELGLTVPPSDTLVFGKTSDDDEIADPELSVPEYDAALFYMRQLGPPPRTPSDPEQEAAGEQVFSTVGCDSCHTPSLNTASGQPVPLYSDLLLHEILDEGTPGIVSGDASMLEFRTAPLWGISQSAPYLHDGRAATLHDAIRLHAGEASASRDQYSALSDEDRAALLSFLQSL